MGIGMVLSIDAKDARKSIDILRENGEDAVILGTVKAGTPGERKAQLV